MNIYQASKGEQFSKLQEVIETTHKGKDEQIGPYRNLKPK